MPSYTQRTSDGPTIVGVLISAAFSLTLFVWTLYFIGCIAAHVGAWPF